MTRYGVARLLEDRTESFEGWFLCLQDALDYAMSLYNWCWYRGLSLWLVEENTETKIYLTKGVAP